MSSGRHAPAPAADARRLAHLSAIVGSSADASWSEDNDGRILTWNRSAERLYGLSATEAVDQLVADLLPNQTDEFLTLRDRARAGERVEQVDTSVRGRDGVLVPVSSSITRILDDDGLAIGLCTVSRDITERLLEQATLSESDARLREGEALAHVGGWVWDAGDDAVQWSDELHNIHGITPFEFDGTLADHLRGIVEEDRERVEAEMRAAAEGGLRLELEYRIHRPDGEVRWLYARADPIEQSGAGSGSGMRGIAQDITERRRVQEALAQAAAAERAAADELRAADLLKDEFLATVSHELRTPLTSILGFAVVLEMAASDEQREYIERISRNAGEMSRMIERLLDFSRLEAGKVEVAPVRLSLNKSTERCVSSLAQILDRHEVVIEAAEELTVVADPEGLDRILGNLLSNAAKFSPAGSTVRLSMTRDNDFALVSLHDAGPGIAPELRTEIFERFFQAPGQPAGKRGTGVGLGIVRRYVELQGGQVWCESGPGDGATFLFTVPLAPPGTDAGAGSLAKGGMSAGGAGR